MQACFDRYDGYTLHMTETGELGWDIAFEYDFDLILMDIHLPGMDGIELTQKLRETEKYKKIPIIAVSAAIMTEEIESSPLLFDAYINKPIQLPKLRDSLTYYLNK